MRLPKPPSDKLGRVMFTCEQWAGGVRALTEYAGLIVGPLGAPPLRFDQHPATPVAPTPSAGAQGGSKAVCEHRQERKGG